MVMYRFRLYGTKKEIRRQKLALIILFYWPIHLMFLWYLWENVDWWVWLIVILISGLLTFMYFGIYGLPNGLSKILLGKKHVRCHHCGNKCLKGQTEPCSMCGNYPEPIDVWKYLKELEK